MSEKVNAEPQDELVDTWEVAGEQVELRVVMGKFVMQRGGQPIGPHTAAHWLAQRIQALKRGGT